jgi:glycine hydroxymethyltransferase
VFPMMQGGPLMHAVAAKAVSLKEASTVEFQNYAKQVVLNAQALSAGLEKEGLRPVSGGTDTHLVLLDLAKTHVTGKDAETRCDMAKITLNKNPIPNDPLPPMTASGIRVGTAAVTTQGMKEPQMQEIAKLIAQAVSEPQSTAEVANQVSQLVAKFPAYPRA